MGKMVFAVDPLSFEYLKMGKQVGKGRDRATSDWLFASVTPTRMLAPGSQRPFQKLCHLARRHVRRSEPGQEREPRAAWGKGQGG